MNKRVGLYAALLTAFLAAGAFFLATPLFAAQPASSGPGYSVDNITVDNRNDFVLEPAKQEVFLDPGQSQVSDIYVTDRVPGNTTFSIEVEDIKGSDDPNAPVTILQPGQTGPYSGKSFISAPITEFTLSFGQRATIPVTVSIPKSASPGGYYSAFLISNEPTVSAEATSTVTRGTTRIISRLGTLFFIRVNGPASQAGALQDFRINAPTARPFYNSGPFTFEVLFNNTGNLYLVPYGLITVRNFLGRDIGDIPVDAYYSLPQSLRYREVPWNQITLFGRYTATLRLNRGYNGLSDTRTIVFWVIPWKFFLIAFGVIFLIILIISLFARTFEIKRK